MSEEHITTSTEEIIEDSEIIQREIPSNLDQSYWGIVKRQFKKNRLAVWSLRFVYVIVFIGLFGDFIANEKPLYCKLSTGETYFPVLKDYGVALGLNKWPVDMINASWKDLSYDRVIWPPVPYSPTEMDMGNIQYVGPFEDQTGIESNRWRHWMGTEEIGRDVFSGMIHGTRIAMLVGIVSMTIAAIIGILLGSLAGYFGDERLKVSRIRLLLNILFFIVGGYFAFGLRSYDFTDALQESMGAFVMQLNWSFLMFIGIMIIPNILSMGLKKLPFLGTQITIPVDIIISRVIEIIISIPRLLLILSIVAAVERSSILLVMMIIGATSWTGIARFLRAELLKVRSLEYIEAAQSLGYSEARIIFRHAIPNSLTSVLIVIAFGIAAAILIESSLSFLGIGVEAEVITWGKLLNFARSAPEAWWLAVIPGFAIFVTVTIFNLLGEGLNDALDPRLKQ